MMERMHVSRVIASLNAKLAVLNTDWLDQFDAFVKDKYLCFQL